ncbi:MAG: SPOR domain-containing protein [Rhodobacteraceae bacterium]|nr:SPOR domain-containing protein [Paracoccaceae bacterium]
MADADFDDFQAYGYEDARADAPGGRFQGWVNGAGALTSLALVAGLGVWGYNLAVRDVRGVPVIRALEGPARVAPENPGGELAVHQGLAVNQITADGTAAAAADRLTLAPKPAALGEEDAAMGRIAPGLESAAVPVAPDFAGTVTPPVPPMAERDATLASLGREEPLPDGPTEPVLGDALTGSAAEVGTVPAEVPGVAQSLRPPLRPAAGGTPVQAAAAEPAGSADYDAMAEAAAAAVAEALAPQELEIPQSSLVAGTRLVQIGAYPSDADARLQWDKTAQRFGALMDGKRRVIEEASSGGSTFYRLRIEGFTDADDADRFCAALRADGAECVAAVVR